MYKCIIKDYFNVGNKKTDEFTVSDMAAYCNVTRQTIHNVLENRKEPTVSLAISMVDFINEKCHDEWYVEDLFKLA